MRPFSFLSRLSILFIASLVVAGCGFVDSAGDNAPPSVSSADLTVNEQTAVTLTSQVTDDFENIISFTWQQKSTGVPVVTLTGSDTEMATFTAPKVAVDTDLEFTITVTDNFNTSATDEVSVRVVSINEAPVAQSDNVVVNEGEQVDLDLIGNDLDDDDDENLPLKAVFVQAPVNGALILDQNNNVTGYVHNGGETASDTFSYVANDGTFNSNEVTVNLTVNPVNDAPEATGVALATMEDTGVIGAVSATDVDSTDFIFSVNANPAQGTVVVTDSSTGAFVYTPTLNTNGADSFVMQVSDGAGGTDTAQVDVTVAPVNDAPIGVANAYAVNEGATLNIAAAQGVLINDTDVDNLLADLSAVIVNAPINAVAFALNADGSFTYTHNGGETTADSFTYRASDGLLSSGLTTVNITINAINDPPVAVNDPRAGVSYTVNQGEVLTINAAQGVLSNDVDPDTAVLTAVLAAAPANALAFALNADGSFSYTHNGVNALPVTFTYFANDGVVNSAATATATITIVPNLVPVASADSGSTTENIPVTINVLGNDNDSDGNLEAGTVRVVSDVANGGTSVNSNTGAITYTPSAGFTGFNSFTYTVEDDDGAVSNVATVNINVSSNSAPQAQNECSTTPQSGTASGNLQASDADNSDNELTFSLVSGPNPNLGQLTVNPDGSYEFDPNNNGRRDTVTFTYRVTDPSGGSDTATGTVIIDSHIMPLGDSITFGSFGGMTPPENERVGYRRSLFNALDNADYPIDFVGRRAHGAAASPSISDPHHEGWGGFTATQIANLVQTALDANPADFVLLHVGTNDGTMPAVSAVEQVLIEIDNWENSSAGNPVTVIVAEIINRMVPSADITAFNNAVRAMALGRGEVVVDMENALIYPGDMADSLHPNTSGYNKMANVWRNALTSRLDRCP